ncbi:MAG: hypothetical protein LBF74_10325, partial [Treponema sp.]|nr:hypothetical protein [Treponema sp.]
MTVEKEKIERDHIVLAEGADARLFLIHLLGGLSLNNIQVLDFGGIHGLTRYLDLFRKWSDYN